MAPLPTLDCQDCGRVLRVLDGAEAQKVADRPYDFILYCQDCAQDHLFPDLDIAPLPIPTSFVNLRDSR